jgi:hypothetical protein
MSLEDFTVNMDYVNICHLTANGFNTVLSNVRV